MTRAETATGLDDFGPSGWEVGLQVLVDSARAAPLRPESIAVIERMIVGRLCRRLAIEDWYRQHGNEASPVESITVIMGLPRSATTAMQHVLALDPRFRFQRSWEIREPVPPPSLVTEADDPRRRGALEAAAARGGTDVRHIVSVDGPVDDGTILGLDFHNQELGLPLHDYTTWWRSSDLSTTYAYHERVLRLLHSQRPPRDWLVKAPYHNFHVDDLAAHYPSARFVMTHRVPAATMPSMCSTVASARGTLIPDEPVDDVALGAFLLEHTVDGIGRAMAARRHIGDERFVDVHQHELEVDPRGTIERVYRFVGRGMDEQLEEEVASWAAANRRGARGEHRYRPEDYGLTTEAIREAFTEYTTTFGVQPETR